MNQTRRIKRSSTNRMIAGVCGGLAHYLNVDATLVRVAFAAGLLFTGGNLFWIYLILWVAIPTESSTAQTFSQQVSQNLSEIQQTATETIEQVSDKVAQFTNSQQPQTSTTSSQDTSVTNQDTDKPSTGPTQRL